MPVIHRVRVDFYIPGYPTQPRLKVKDPPPPPTKMVENPGIATALHSVASPSTSGSSACQAISPISSTFRMDFPSRITTWMQQVTSNSLDTFSHGYGETTNLQETLQVWTPFRHQPGDLQNLWPRKGPTCISTSGSLVHIC